MTERTYKNPSCVKFVADMEAAGLKVRHYRGRGFWEGPAVSADGIQDVLSNTKIKCQWDQLGLGVIVYPIARDKGVE